MSRLKRLARNRTASSLTVIAALVLATTAWTAFGQLTGSEQDFRADPSTTPAERLEAPLPQPEQVFLQLTNQFPALGNVLVSVELGAKELADKQKEGTRDFVTIGNRDATTILRDDGQSGDAVAGDGLFTGIAHVDVAELEARSASDQEALENAGSQEVPVFEGRTVVGTRPAVPFDIGAFKAGARVRFDPAVVFLEPESGTDEEWGGTSAGTVGTTGAVTAAITQPGPIVKGTNAFQNRVLMIRALGVVNDPTRTFNPCSHPANGVPAGNAGGVWTFNHLMTEMANPAASGIDQSFFVEEWLKHWAAGRTINGDNVAARAQITALINLWKSQSANGKLDLAKSPLRLLAIAPRIDLRTTTGGGGAYSTNASGNFLDAGEARFIFGFVLRPGWNGAGFLGAAPIPGTAIGPGANDSCRALPFTVIFEYRVPKCECEMVRDWARRWKALASFAPGSAAYNNRLERLTEQFVLANSNPAKPNGSALGQLRTNEVALTAPWELREFQLVQFPFSLLSETTAADTPEDAFNNTAVFQDWVQGVVGPQLTPCSFEDSIPPVPLFFTSGFTTHQFLGANPQVPDAPANLVFHWKAPGLTLSGDPFGCGQGHTTDNWARHRASRATCNGCHRRETLTPFTHVDPSNVFGAVLSPALPARISKFLTGVSVTDPAEAMNRPTRNFDDLARREDDIKKVAGLSCFGLPMIDVGSVKDSIQATGKLPRDLFIASGHHVSVAVDDMRRNLITEVH